MRRFALLAVCLAPVLGLAPSALTGQQDTAAADSAAPRWLPSAGLGVLADHGDVQAHGWLLALDRRLSDDLRATLEVGVTTHWQRDYCLEGASLVECRVAKTWPDVGLGYRLTAPTRWFIMTGTLKLGIEGNGGMWFREVGAGVFFPTVNGLEVGLEARLRGSLTSFESDGFFWLFRIGRGGGLGLTHGR